MLLQLLDGDWRLPTPIRMFVDSAREIRLLGDAKRVVELHGEKTTWSACEEAMDGDEYLVRHILMVLVFSSPRR